MDYYYALLNSYDLLKKRKFKLSLREQEKGSATQEVSPEAIEQAADEAEAALMKAVEQPPQETAVETNLGVNRDISLFVDGTGTQSGDKNAMHRTVRVGGVEGAYGSTIKFKATEIEKIKWTKKNTNGYKLARAWAGATEIDYKKALEDDGVPRNRFGVDMSPEARRMRGELIDGGPIIRNVVNLGWSPEDEEKLKKQLEGINTNTQEFNNQLEDEKAKGERLDEEVIDIEGVMDAVFNLTKLALELKNNNSLGDSETTEGIAFSNEITKFLLDNKITIDKGGVVRFDNISLGITQDTPIGQAIAKSIKDLDAVQKRSQQVLGQASPAVRPKKLGREDRGVAGENFDVLAANLERCMTQEKGGDYDIAECEAFFNMLKAEVVFSTKKDKMSFVEKTAHTFITGQQALDETLLVDSKGRLNAQWVNFTREQLAKRMIEHGMDPQRANEYAGNFLKAIVQRTCREGKQPPDCDKLSALKVFIALMVANGNFSRNIFGKAVPSSSESTGQGQDKRSNVLAAKVDVRDHYHKGQKKGEYKNSDEIKEQVRDNLLTDQQKDYYEEGCKGEDMDTILNELIREGDDGYEVDRELKIHGKQGDSSWGQTSHRKRDKAFSYLCAKTEDERKAKTSDLTTDEREALDNLKTVMENGGCLEAPTGKGSKKKKKENKAKIEEACKFQKGIADEVKTKVTKPLDINGGRTKEQLKTTLKTLTGTDSKWYKSKRRRDKADADKRLASSIKYVERMKDPTRGAPKKPDANASDSDNEDYEKYKQEKEDYEKLQYELENTIISKHLDMHTKDGFLEEPALGFAQIQYGMTVQGLHETLNDKRVLEKGGSQYTSLRNAEARANIRGGRFKRSPGSRTISILGKDQYDLSESGLPIGLDDLVDDAEYKEMKESYAKDKANTAKREKEGKPPTTAAKKRIKAFETQKQRRELKEELETAGKTVKARNKLYKKYPLAAPLDNSSRVTLSAERDTMVVNSGSSKAITRQVTGATGATGATPFWPSVKPKEEHLLMSFFKGQQALLEKLMNRTT